MRSLIYQFKFCCSSIIGFVCLFSWLYNLGVWICAWSSEENDGFNNEFLSKSSKECKKISQSDHGEDIKNDNKYNSSIDFWFKRCVESFYRRRIKASMVTTFTRRSIFYSNLWIEYFNIHFMANTTATNDAIEKFLR